MNGQTLIRRRWETQEKLNQISVLLSDATSLVQIYEEKEGRWVLRYPMLGRGDCKAISVR